MDNRQELIDLISRLVAVQYPENEESYLISRISELSLDPEWSDYIFYPKEFIRSDGSVDIEMVVDKILSPKNILL